MNKKIGAIILLSIVLLGMAAVLVHSFQTKYYFSRDECRYIFKQGSCVVADEHCNLNSYNYVKKVLDPRTDCVSQITFNEGFAEEDIEEFDSTEDLEVVDGECPFVVVESDYLKIRPEAVDPDPEIGPAGKLVWTFFQPLDDEGGWQTVTGDAGRHNTKVQVSDGEYSDTKAFCIEVLASNHAPVLEAIEDILVAEGETVSIDASCADEDGDDVTITYSGWMDSDEKRAGFGDEGEHTVTVKCTDTEGASDTERVTVTVTDVNRAPTLRVSDITVKEGELVELDVDVADIDGDDVTTEISDPVGDDGVWQTEVGDAGKYSVTVTVSDGEDTVSKTVTVTVVAVNVGPTFSDMSDVTVYEGQTVRLNPVVSDEDGDDVTVEYSGWMTSATKKTDYDDAGVYDVVVTVSDGKEEVKQNVKVTVLNRNRPPKITAVYMEEPTEAVQRY